MESKSYKYLMEEPLHRFMDKVDIGDNLCWLFPYVDRFGYSRLYFGRSPEKGHRLMYRIFKGEIPNGYEIDHLCSVKNCINPDHLEAVPHKENMARLFASMRSCRRGHMYTADSHRVVKYKNDKYPSRLCLACQRIRDIKKISRRKYARTETVR